MNAGEDFDDENNDDEEASAGEGGPYLQQTTAGRPGPADDPPPPPWHRQIHGRPSPPALPHLPLQHPQPEFNMQMFNEQRLAMTSGSGDYFAAAPLPTREAMPAAAPTFSSGNLLNPTQPMEYQWLANLQQNQV